MTFLLAISRGIDAVTTALGRIMWWLTLLMVLAGFVNVFGRYGYDTLLDVFGSGAARALSGNTYIEVQIYAFSFVFLLGAAYVFKADAHVRVDILFSRLSARRKAAVDIFGVLVFLIPFCWLGIHYSQSYVARSWGSLEVSTNPGGLLLYPLKTAIVVAFALLIVQGVSELIKNAAFLAGHPRSGSMHAHDETSAGGHVADATTVTPGGENA